MESGVEVVNHSDVLMRLGGVGCLLRFFSDRSNTVRRSHEGEFQSCNDLRTFYW